MNITTEPFLKIDPDSIDIIRKNIGFNNYDSFKRSIDILNEWIKKQPHFTKKEFSSRYLERVILTCKGSVERSKRQLDKVCTFRTLMPHFFQMDSDDFEKPFNFLQLALQQRATDDYYRLVLVKLLHSKPSSKELLKFYKYLILGAEYLKYHDYVIGFSVVCDLSEINIYELLTHLNLMQLKNILTVLAGGYGMRIKTINIISNSSAFDLLDKAIKFIIAANVHKKIKIYKSTDKIKDDIPRKLLPLDYGGDDKTMAELADDFFKELTSKKHWDYVAEASKARTDETLRIDKQHFNDEYAGIEGTFRTLSLD